MGDIMPASPSWKVGAAALLLPAFLCLVDCRRAGEEKMPLQTVPHVDVHRYMGIWYEIAKYPNRFQKNCYAATATYSLRPDGGITVENRCRRGSPTGPEKSIRGRAWVTDSASNAKLKVRFFWPFSGKYWIIQLDEEYRYAVVSEPKRRFLWILARRPILEEEVYQGILRLLEEQGFSVKRLERTAHPQ